MLNFSAHETNYAQREIVKSIEISRSAVSREMARNTGERGCRHKQAQALSIFTRRA